MGLIASLDIGSEKMVMAVASQENGNYHWRVSNDCIAGGDGWGDYR